MSFQVLALFVLPALYLVLRACMHVRGGFKLVGDEHLRSSAKPSEARLRRAKRGPAERSEARAVNRALRARIKRKLEAIKQEAT